jgi:hypothetical protein
VINIPVTILAILIAFSDCKDKTTAAQKVYPGGSKKLSSAAHFPQNI